MQPIPIIAILAFVALVMVSFLLFRLFRKQRLSPALKNFRTSLLFAAIIAILYTLPGTAIKDLYIISIIYIIIQVFFLFIFFFLLRFIREILEPTQTNFLVRILPTSIAIWTVLYLLLQLIQLKMIGPIQPLIIENKFMIYTRTFSILPTIITGLITAFSSLVGSIAVFKKIAFLKEKRLILRSLLIGLGFLALVFWTVSGWIISRFSGLEFFSIIATIFAIVGLVLISIAVFFVKVKEESY